MSQNKHTYDIVIVGAGIIGAAQALLLVKRLPQIRIAIIDQARQAVFPKNLNLRATALGQQAKTILEECEIWRQLPNECICAYDKMVVLDEQSEGELTFDSKELGALTLGHIVDHFALQALLQKAVADHSQITEFYECTISEVIFPEKALEISLENINEANEQPIKVRLNDGSMQLRSKLLIAADGVNSQVREIAGIDVCSATYDQSGIVAVIQTEREHQSTAWQRFLTTGPLAFLPLSNGDSSIVWTVNNSGIEELSNADENTFCQRLQAATQGCFGKLTLKSSRHVFSLNSQRALQYYKNNVVLIGDAAHGIHPLAGQGANLGFADIASLAEQLAEFPEQLSHSALRRYERQRKANNYAVDTAMTLIQRSFANSITWISLLRGFGMKMINQNKSLQRLLFGLASRR